MDLWNEYEGKVLAEPYPLEKLIYTEGPDSSEGLSGFFSTSNSNGTPAVIRLTEALKDGADLLTLWHSVARLDEPHLIALTSFGETIVDRVPLTFAVMERPDTNLAQILSERPMTAEETRQIATSLVSALIALHDHDLAHGRLTPENVFAIGETIKLRSDCARKIANQDDGAKLKARDVRDLAILLLECLTQKRVEAGALSQPPQVPSPFDEIILRGSNGSWGLQQIKHALEPNSGFALKDVAKEDALDPEEVEALKPKLTSTEPEPEVPTEASPAPPAGAETEPFPETIPVRHRTLLLVAASAAALLVLFLGLRSIASHPPEAASQSSRASGTSATAAVAPSLTSQTPSNQVPLSPQADGSGDAAASPNDASWRIVAYSFRREKAAKKKARALLRKHPWIEPEVVRATGRLPYLVTLGGRMTREEALAFEQKLHQQHFHRAVHLREMGAK